MSIRLRNLTLHQFGAMELTLASRLGFELTELPEGIVVEPGHEGLEKAAGPFADRLRECAWLGEGVIVGGHTALWLSAVIRLLNSGDALPDFYYFDTRRHRDDNGRFVFVAEDIVRVAIEPQDTNCHC